MPRLPRKMRTSQSPFGVEWNAMCDYLASLKPIDGPNVHTDHTPFGVARKSYGRGAISAPSIPTTPEPETEGILGFYGAGLLGTPEVKDILVLPDDSLVVCGTFTYAADVDGLTGLNQVARPGLAAILPNMKLHPVYWHLTDTDGNSAGTDKPWVSHLLPMSDSDDGHDRFCAFQLNDGLSATGWVKCQGASNRGINLFAMNGDDDAHSWTSGTRDLISAAASGDYIIGWTDLWDGSTINGRAIKLDGLARVADWPAVASTTDGFRSGSPATDPGDATIFNASPATTKWYAASNGTAYTGAPFTHWNGTDLRAYSTDTRDRRRLVRFSDATVDEIWDGFDGPINGIIHLSDSPAECIVYGAFNNWLTAPPSGATARSKIAKLSASGSLASDFSSFTVDRAIACAARQSDGKIVCAISGTTDGSIDPITGLPLDAEADGTQVYNVFRIGTTGALDTTFHSVVLNAGNSINVLRLLSDDTIVLGGTFTTVDTQDRSNFCHLDANGNLLGT